MNPVEFGFAAVLIAVLLGLAGYFGWRQVQALRSVSSQAPISVADYDYVRSQARRRLICSGLMVVFAGLLFGWFFLESSYRELRDELAGQNERAPQAEPTPEQKDQLRLFAVYWIAGLVVLLSLVWLAAVDFWAIARFGLRKQRELQADHRALLKREVSQRRRQGNGQH